MFTDTWVKRNGRWQIVAMEDLDPGLATLPRYREDLAAIRALRSANNRAIAAHDLAAFLPMFADDAVFTWSNGSSAVGKAALRGFFASDFADPNFTSYVRTPCSISVSDGGARAIERGSWTALKRGTRYGGDYAAHWMRMPEGWRVRGELYVKLYGRDRFTRRDPAGVIGPASLAEHHGKGPSPRYRRCRLYRKPRCPRARDAGWRVAVIDDCPTVRASWCRATCPSSRSVAERVLVDSIIDDLKIGAIMHFAGSIVVPESVEQPLKYYANNTVASHNLISAAVDGGVKHILFSSTAAVYGAPERVPIAEDDPKLPINPYGASKLMTERMLADASARTRSTTARCVISTSPAPIRRAAPARSARARPTSSRSRSKRRSASASRWRSTAPIIRRRTAPASATTSTSATSPRPMSRRSTG